MMGLRDFLSSSLGAFGGRSSVAEMRAKIRDEQAREMFASQNFAYKIGRVDRANFRHQPQGRTENAAITESADLANRRTRDGYRNTPTVKHTTDLLRDLLVGCGINAYCDPIDASFGFDFSARTDDDLLNAINFSLESDELFEEYAEDPHQFDVEGRKSWYDTQRMAISEQVLVGDAIIFEAMMPRKGAMLPLCYKLVEQEQIDKTRDRSSSRGVNAIVNGFEIDEHGREVGCYVLTDHPHDSFNSTGIGGYRSEFYPSRRYRHLFLPTRPSQFSGFTMLAAQGQTMRDRDIWVEQEIRIAVKAALQLIVAKFKNPNKSTLGLENSDDDYTANEELALNAGPIAYELGLDESVEMIESNRPNAKANDFFDILDTDLASAVNLSAPTFRNRFAGHTYEGIRGALQLEKAQLQPIQEFLGRNLVLPVRRRFNELAVSTGLLKHLAPAEFLREKRRWQTFDVIAPGRTLLNLDKETEGQMAAMRAGLQTLKLACMERGLHWLRVLRQMALEKRVASALGLVLDYSKGQGGERTTTTTDANRNDQAQQTGQG